MSKWFKWVSLINRIFHGLKFEVKLVPASDIPFDLDNGALLTSGITNCMGPNWQCPLG